MKNLNALVQLIHTQKIEGFHLFQSKEGSISKMEELYNYIKDTDNPNDEEAMELLGYSDKQSPAYKMLKKRLEERLLNTVILLDSDRKEFSNLAREYFLVSKGWITGTLLINRNLRVVAIPLLEKSYVKANKYEFTRIAYLIGEELKKHYAYIGTNNRRFNFYVKETSRLQKVLEAEILAENYYSNISNLYAIKRSSNLSEIRSIASKYTEELIPMLDKVSSSEFSSRTFEIASFNYIINNRFEKAIKVCKRAISSLDDKPFFNQYTIFANQKDIAICHIKLGNYQEARKYIISNMKIQDAGTFNWFNNMAYYFIVSSFQKNYQKLLEITSTITKNKNFTNYDMHYQSWRIKEAYIHFLIRAGKIQPNEAFPLRPFRLNRFLNEVPFYAKDKRGLNITILIVQILFFILDRKLSKIEDRLETLNQYSYKYLRNDSTFRSNCFIKMLLKLPEADYNPVRTRRYVDKYHKKLLSTSINISEYGGEVEIIPYEQLWEIVMETIERKKKVIKSAET